MHILSTIVVLFLSLYFNLVYQNQTTTEYQFDKQSSENVASVDTMRRNQTILNDIDFHDINYSIDLDKFADANLYVHQSKFQIDNPCDPAVSGNIDTDRDGISDVCDFDDDNDGILDIVECPLPTNSNINGNISNFTFDISSSNPPDRLVSHTLNSITVNGTTYTDFILPDGFASAYTVYDLSHVSYVLNGTIQYTMATNTNFDNDILQAFNSRNLNSYHALDFSNYSDGDYFILNYNTPILSTAGGFLAVTERSGNNPQIIEALDINDVVIGTINVSTSHYVDLGVNVHFNSGTQNAHMALYPVDDLAPVGDYIHKLRISFGPTATSDGPDTKVFFFGNNSLLTCDYDNDGILNHLDLDSDNDNCPDAIEGGGSFTAVALLNDRLTGGVNSNGIPNVIQSGQSLGSSQNENQTNCPEICNNGIDDDGDGFVDCNDNDCVPEAPGAIRRN